MRKDELYHHGIKGMKWGIRKDGRIRKTIKRTKDFVDKHPRLKKVLKTTGNVATDIATLGVSRKIRKREKLRRENGNKAKPGTVGLRAISRTLKFGLHKDGIALLKTIAAVMAVSTYVIKKKNPKVKEGAIRAGKILNTIGDISIATLGAYSVYDTARDVNDAYGKYIRSGMNRIKKKVLKRKQQKGNK